MASAGWDEVLGGNDGDGGGDPPPPVDDGDGEDEAPAKKKRLKTSTKIVLVVAGWLLLTLFLVGKFSSDKPQPSAVARLDTLSGDEAGDAAAEEEEAFEPEPVDTAEEELLDADGDGFLSAQELGINEGEAAAAAESSGSGSGSGGAVAGTPTGEGGSGGGNAVPGAAPGGGGSTGGGTSGGGGTTSTTAGGGGGGGGTTSTPTTAKPGTTTTTTISTTTTAPPTTTTTGANVPSTATSSYRGSTTGFEENDVTVRLSNGSATVTVTNATTSDHFFALDAANAAKIKDGESKTYTFTAAGDHTVTQVTSGKELTIHVLA